MSMPEDVLSKLALLTDRIDSLTIEEKAYILEEIQSTMSPRTLARTLAMSDQMSKESKRASNILLQSSPSNVTMQNYTDRPEWVRLPAQTTLVKWFAGVARTCMHSPTPEQAKTVLAAAWEPDLVVCMECEHMLWFKPGSVRDRTCDLCGHVAAGGEEDPISGFISQFGLMMYAFGACDSCERDTLSSTSNNEEPNNGPAST